MPCLKVEIFIKTQMQETFGIKSPVWSAIVILSYSSQQAIMLYKSFGVWTIYQLTICFLYDHYLNVSTHTKILKMKALAFVTEDVENEPDSCGATCDICETDCVTSEGTYSSEVCFFCVCVFFSCGYEWLFHMYCFFRVFLVKRIILLNLYCQGNLRSKCVLYI